MTLNDRIRKIEELFNSMHYVPASNWQIQLIKHFKINNPELIDDLDFCFEVLAGMHKVGYTFTPYTDSLFNHVIKWAQTNIDNYANMSIKEFYKDEIVTYDLSASGTIRISYRVPQVWHSFFDMLVNRKYKLGYTNKNNMLTDKHCMLAKSYPQHMDETGAYYVQEKLNGVRCIAYFEEGKWKYLSRSQKPYDYPFDTRGLDPDRIYDGEVMTRNKLTNRDFNTTSGLANSKYGDKKSLMYFIYDIIDPDMTYAERYTELKRLTDLSKDIVVLDVLPSSYDKEIWFLWRGKGDDLLDKLLDEVVARGGEGLILRKAHAKYYQSKHSGDRNSALLKYKQVKTCDLRIVGFNEGKGKYEGMIGSFICESDDGLVQVSVAGISDDIRMTDPELLMGQIIEVAYFDISKSKVNNHYSLQFPRFKGFRHDKDETSIF